MMRRSAQVSRVTAATAMAAQVRTSYNGWGNFGRPLGTNKGEPNTAAIRAEKYADAKARKRADEERMKPAEPPAAKPHEEPFWTKGAYAPKASKPDTLPAGESDKLKDVEYETAWGKYETRPGWAGHPAQTGQWNKEFREKPEMKTKRVWGLSPASEHDGQHHPLHDYTAKTGERFNYNTQMTQPTLNWDIKLSMHGLYKAALRGLPLVKQFYFLVMPLEQMKKRIRTRFDVNKHVKDPEAIKMLVHHGWMDYTETICFRKTKGATGRMFEENEDGIHLKQHYYEQEKSAIQDRMLWNGGETLGKDGPYDGFWSTTGKYGAEQVEALAGRIPPSFSDSKGYFENWKPDGTNYWEKNMDYEGWMIKNVDPDRAAARKELQAWVEAGYNQPKHYASKNRRSYRRLVKEIDNLMNMSTHVAYAATREQLFQSYVREWCPESNRIYAEKKLARNDDNVFTMKYDEHDEAFKQACREFPNPRLWKTDVFFLRMRKLTAHLEYNWAKAPIGVEFERAYNEWVSNDAHHTVITSPAFARLKTDKKRNPMAKTWADFYTEFDPDVPETRRLPWYHPEFNYDRRYHWDERCMRMKKWVQTGDIDFRNDFFAAQVAEWEQMVNRPETARKAESVEFRYVAPRMVQLYRSLGKRMDMALANQMLEYVLTQQKLAANSPQLTTHGDANSVSAVNKALAETDFADFKFDPPTVIFPDNYEQPLLAPDGRALQVSQ